MSPDSRTLDLSFLPDRGGPENPGAAVQDYQTNIDRYPVWQALMRKRQFPALDRLGQERTQRSIAPGAEAYLRDLPKAELHLIDAGIFAVEEWPQEIAGYILASMGKR